MATGFPDAAPRTPSRRHALRLVSEIGDARGYRVAQDVSDAVCNLTLRYRNTLGSPDQIVIDLDLLDRMTLLPPTVRQGPTMFGADDLTFQVVSPPELLGQKLTAVVYRTAPRDLFDMYLMLLAGWSREPRARAMYLAYSFLHDHEWPKLSYVSKLNVDYRPKQLEAVLRGKDTAPTLDKIREQARFHLEQISQPFTSATEEEQELRARLLVGDREAFGLIAGEQDADRRKALADHPGLRWRLQQAGRRTTFARMKKRGGTARV